MALSLTDLATVKTYLKKEGATDDARLSFLIPVVSRRIERYLGRADGFELKERVELIPHVPEIPAGKVWGYSLNVAPVVSVASVIVDEDHAFVGDGATTLVENEDFVVHRGQGRIEFDGYRPTLGEKTVQVTYTAGIAPDAATLVADEDYADLVFAATIQVGYIFDRRNNPGATSENVNGATRSQKALAFLPEVVELLQPWKRRKFR